MMSNSDRSFLRLMNEMASIGNTLQRASSPASSMFERSALRAARSLSTNVPDEAPLRSASSPTEPVPAKRSRNEAPGTFAAMVSKMTFRTRLEVGLICNDLCDTMSPVLFELSHCATCAHYLAVGP